MPQQDTCKLLTLVVPTYNMEKYLPRCLDSVTGPSIPSTLEVIVVNDGSRDRSLDIMEAYREKWPGIVRVIDKPNGHYGSCINAALRLMDEHDRLFPDNHIDIRKWRNESHDRWLIIDDSLYHCGHSLNANGGHKISAITLMGTSPEVILSKVE